MLADDDQFANFLAMNGLLDAEAIARMRIAAELEERPLYVAVIEKGAVAEAKLVAMMSQLLGVPSVALAEFEGDPAVMGMVPVEMIRDGGVLPIGVDDSSGSPILWVAMANPSDVELLQQVQARAGVQVAPLLAGPVDLLAAIERNLGSLSRISAPREPSLDLPAFPDDGDEVDLVEDVAFASGIGTRSALSMLDDIPRDRHEQVTSPSGVISLAEMVNSGEHIAASAAMRAASDSQLGRSAVEYGERAFDAGAPPSPFGAPGEHAAPEQDANESSGFVRFSPMGRQPAKPLPPRTAALTPGPTPASSAPPAAPAPGTARAALSPSTSSPPLPFRSPERPDPSGQTGIGMPAEQSGGPFTRRLNSSTGSAPVIGGVPLRTGSAAVVSGSQPAVDILETEAPDMLVRALASILMRRGLVTERELRDEIQRLRATGRFG